MTARPVRSPASVCLALAVIAGAFVPAFAAAQVTARTTGRELREMFSDFGHLVQSPLRADRSDWAGVAATGAGFAALLAVDKPVDDWVVRHPNAPGLELLAPFRENGGVLNRLVTARHLVPLSSVLVIAGSLSDKRGLREAGLGCIAGWGVSNVMRYATYALVSRDRPSAAEGNPLAFSVPGGKWDQHAFPAGHAMNAFACASFWSARFELSAGEPVLYTVASLTSLSRIADRRHWTSDTFVAVVTGIAIGHTIARRYDEREARREARAAALDGGRAAASNPADRAARHSRLVAGAPVVVLWRARF